MTAKLSISLSTKFQVSYRITLHLTANIITVSNVQAWATNDEHQAIYDPEQHLLSIKQYITAHKERHINISNPCQAVGNIWKTSEAHIEQWAIYNKHKQNTRSSEQSTNMNKTWQTVSKIQIQATHSDHCATYNKNKQDTGIAQITYCNAVYTIYHGRHCVLSAAEGGVPE